MRDEVIRALLPEDFLGEGFIHKSFYDFVTGDIPKPDGRIVGMALVEHSEADSLLDVPGLEDAIMHFETGPMAMTVSLIVEDDPIDWPSDWPMIVTPKFLLDKGWEIV